ncbi:ABC-2 type transporter [Mycobacteroides abscessus subsp. abscessus]|nr:ABC-2 type transporter [Mycobacteroides abscessus subsp. abscessus]HEO8420330.1 YhgE/Pip domain-containing protein [Yersinia enterocolitica]HEO8422869.1 YhgE/Pip domain-containing protein [Yersinia enterocolitica]
MKGIQLIKQDLMAMWKHPHGRIALIFLIMVPLIYASFFLAGYWNPYGNLDNLPVAVVNQDKGAMMDGDRIEAGDDLIKELKGNKELEFHFISEEKAETGLKDGDYYTVLTIPKDFSKNISTLMDDHPIPAKLISKTNPGGNFVASQISSTAVERINEKISKSITKTYAEGVFSKFSELAEGLKKAGDGADELHQGMNDAKNAMVKLDDGYYQLEQGMNQLTVGSNKLLKGEEALSSGGADLEKGSLSLSEGMDKLTVGLDSLIAGEEQVAAGVKQWSSSNETLLQGQTKANEAAKLLQDQMSAYSKSHPEAGEDPEFLKLLMIANGLAEATGQLQTGQTQLAQGAQQVTAGQENINSGLDKFSDKLDEAAAGANDLASGTVKFNDGLDEWSEGYASLNNGINKAAHGTVPLKDGTEKIMDGLSQLSDGTYTLSSSLDAAAIETASVKNSNSLTDMFSEPVILEQKNVSNVPNYGSGIAPYFLSLAFFVGGIMASNILPLGRRKELIVNGTHHLVNKLGLVYTIGFVQAIIVDVIVLSVFKLEVASIPLFVLSSIIVSFTFMTFILMLVTVFGLVGKFLAVTFLVFQLASCSGTFPMELGNPILSKIGQWMPMAHSLKSLQEVISLGNWHELQNQLFILVIYLAVAGIIAWVASHIQHRESYAQSTLS